MGMPANIGIVDTMLGSLTRHERGLPIHHTADQGRTVQGGVRLPVEYMFKDVPEKALTARTIGRGDTAGDGLWGSRRE